MPDDLCTTDNSQSQFLPLNSSSGSRAHRAGHPFFSLRVGVTSQAHLTSLEALRRRKGESEERNLRPEMREPKV